MLQVLKEDLRSLNEDTMNMGLKMNESFQGFGWVVSEKLQDLQAYTSDVKGKAHSLVQKVCEYFLYYCCFIDKFSLLLFSVT